MNKHEVPTLPKGYFFRVKPGELGVYVVQLRRKIIGRFSYLIDHEATDHDQYILRAMRILKGAAWPETRGNPENYGDFPPKTHVWSD